MDVVDFTRVLAIDVVNPVVFSRELAEDPMFLVEPDWFKTLGGW
jgi:hypothetical protein